MAVHLIRPDFKSKTKIWKVKKEFIFNALKFKRDELFEPAAIKAEMRKVRMLYEQRYLAYIKDVSEDDSGKVPSKKRGRPKKEAKPKEIKTNVPGKKRGRPKKVKP